jgi:hypothetical protein
MVAPPGSPAQNAASRWQDGVVAEMSEELRRKLDAVFGEALPAVTRDETGEDEPRSGSDPAGDEWLRANRPPHHDQD